MKRERSLQPKSLSRTSERGSREKDRGRRGPGGLLERGKEASRRPFPGGPPGRPLEAAKNREKCGLQSGGNRPPDRGGYMPGRPHPGGPALLERSIAGPFFPFQAFLASLTQALLLSLSPAPIPSLHTPLTPFWHPPPPFWHPQRPPASGCRIPSILQDFPSPTGPSGIPREIFHSGILFGTQRMLPIPWDFACPKGPFRNPRGFFPSGIFFVRV